MASLSYKALINQRLAESNYFYLVKDLKVAGGLLLQGTRIFSIELKSCDAQGNCLLALEVYDREIDRATVKMPAVDFSTYFRPDEDLNLIDNAIYIGQQNLEHKRKLVRVLCGFGLPICCALLSGITLWLFQTRFGITGIQDAGVWVETMVFFATLFGFYFVGGLMAGVYEHVPTLATRKDVKGIEHLKTTLTDIGYTPNTGCTLDGQRILTDTESERRLRELYQAGETKSKVAIKRTNNNLKQTGG